MKRVLSIILCLGILLSLILPASGAAGSGSSMTLGTTPRGAVSVDTDRLARLASGKRSALEDNLVFPGPLVDYSTYTPEYGEELPLGYYATGKPNQYMCMVIYYGTDTDTEPVSWDYIPFEMEKGYGTETLYWKKSNAPIGEYTLVTFTGEEEDNRIYPVEGTVYATTVYVYETQRQRESIFMADAITGETLDTVYLTPGETAVFAVGRSPKISDGEGRLLFRSSNCSVEEAGGYFFLSSGRCSNGDFSIWYGDHWTNAPVEVCYSPKGHTNGEAIPAGSPTEELWGYTLQVCETCGSVKKNEICAYLENFYGFYDIPQTAWYYDSVRTAVGKNLFNGINTTTFGPDRAMTRAMLVTVLWRFEGSPSASAADFQDVKTKDWFAEAVNWAAETEIVNGVGKGKFNPNGNVTREQFATILYRYAGLKELDTVSSGYPMSYPDEKNVSTWAQDAMAWATEKELITGIGKNGSSYLTPMGNATRAQVATILVRMIQRFFTEPIQYPDLSTALDGGNIPSRDAEKPIVWGYFEGGILEIGGEGEAVNLSNAESAPWIAYQKEINEIRFLNGTHTIWGIFGEYPALETVVMADSVSSVSDNAFYKCPKLKNIRFSSGLVSIGENAFRQCRSLETLSLPDGAPMYISQYAFADNTKLASIYFGNNIRSIGHYAFKKCTALKDIVLPDSIHGDAIGTHAFYGCYALESAVLPMGLTYLHSAVFYDCTSLKNVSMPLALKTLESSAFRNCTSLESLVFGPCFRKIRTGAFMGCISLKELLFLCDSVYIDLTNITNDTEEDSLPFGNPDQVVIYAYPDTNILKQASDYGYKAVDISTLLN